MSLGAYFQARSSLQTATIQQPVAHLLGAQEFTGSSTAQQRQGGKHTGLGAAAGCALAAGCGFATGFSFATGCGAGFGVGLGAGLATGLVAAEASLFLNAASGASR